MASDKELVRKGIEQALHPQGKPEKAFQSMEWCIKFAIKDLQIDKKEVTEEAVLKRAKELYAIHGE